MRIGEVKEEFRQNFEMGAFQFLAPDPVSAEIPWGRHHWLPVHGASLPRVSATAMTGSAPTMGGRDAARTGRQ